MTGGTKRQAVNQDTGQVLSRRQFDALRGQPLSKGGTGKLDRFYNLVDSYRRQEEARTGVKMTRGQARSDPDFQRAYKELNNQRKLLKRIEESEDGVIRVQTTVNGRRVYQELDEDDINRRRGKLADALRKLGRKKDFIYDVGDTP